VSDGSTDATVDKAREAGVNVLELNPNRGKGGAIAAGIDEFNLCDEYEAVLLLDADTVLSEDYLESALPYFSDPEVAVVCGTAVTMWRPREVSPVGQLLLAYRERMYYWGQTFLKYGQAWRRCNAVLVVPGFASMYRTTALRHIDVNAPGLVVEDLNMTFEIHHRRLGKIAFHPRVAVAYTQDPVLLSDYVRQVRRWALVLWQTVRRHGFFHGGFFWGSLTVCVVELTLNCLILASVPVLLTIWTISAVAGHQIFSPSMGVAGSAMATYIPIVLLIFVVLPECFVTVVVAIGRRRPRYLLFALAFPLLRILDAILYLYTLPLAWIERSSGAWSSPERREITHVESQQERTAQERIAQ
jgi:biofilm PGA synthesis N-glycosyltransferase PgaC